MIDVLYEHPAWFARLFEGLEARGVAHRQRACRGAEFPPGLAARCRALAARPTCWSTA